MGRAKKGQKQSKDEEPDSDAEVETSTTESNTKTTKAKNKSKSKPENAQSAISDDEGNIESNKPSKKKKNAENDKAGKGATKDMKKGAKKKDVSSEDDSHSEAESLDVKPNKAKNEPKRGGFALLQLEDSDNEEEKSEHDDISEEEEKPIVSKKQTTKEQPKEIPGKKGKKAKKKKNDDEDIDQVLAELEIEYSGKKHTGGKKDKTLQEKQTTNDDNMDENDVTKENETVEETSAVKTAAQKKKEKKLKQQLAKKLESTQKETTPETSTQNESAVSLSEKPKQLDEKPKQLDEKPKQLDEKPEQLDEKPKQLDEKPKQLDEKPKQLDEKPKQLDEKPKQLDEKPKQLDEKPKPLDEKPKELEEKFEQSEEKPSEEKGDEESDKKKKKKKGEKVVEEKAKKGPAKKAIVAMQEALKKLKEEEERLQREEEERIRLEEEREQQRLEQLRIEKEKKDRKKQKEKERKERLKAEGKFMTAKQKADKARALAMVESLKEQGAEINVEEKPKKARLGTRIRPNKLKRQTSEEQAPVQEESAKIEVEEIKEEPKIDEVVTTKENEEDNVQDAWDADSVESDNGEVEVKTKVDIIEKKQEVEVKKVEESDSSDDEDTESDDDSDSSEGDRHDEKNHDSHVIREKVLLRMRKREEEYEANKSSSTMRAAVVCVLGHVDTGKTKILDKLRRTNVQDGEAGGITQQIGATNVPIDNIKEQTRHVKGVNQIEFKIPGLLIIDTPGHESFSNLRSRGSSLCDIAILVVDIMHGLEPQTIESINLLKARKTPFIVALNKIDRLYDWQSAQRKDVKDIIKSQHTNTQNEFETRTKEVMLQFAEQGLNAALYYENPDVRTYVSLVPTSAVTGEGMGNLLTLIVQSCETLLHKRLLFSQQLQATVLEVKAISGLGMTIDCILINGTLREGDTVVLAGTDGPIVTQIRSLLMPQPMKELRVKNAYIEYKEVIAAQGVKITAKDLEKAVAGLNLQVAQKTDEIDILKEEVTREFKSALSGIKLTERGVYVQASTLGSLEALLEFLKASKIPYSAIRIGPVVKRDVMKASAMLEHEPQYAAILAFDVKVERDAQEMADSVGVTIFQADIIYHLFDKFMQHREQLRLRKREEFKHIAVFPCKLRILPQYVFNSRDPIVIGVIVEAGIVKEGTPICVPSKEFVEIGVVTSIEVSHKQVESARKGTEVCVKIDPIPGESPKMFGRHFDEKDFLVSKISRQSIDACKDYFREDLLKTDWQLMVELKNLFQIL